MLWVLLMTRDGQIWTGILERWKKEKEEKIAAEAAVPPEPRPCYSYASEPKAPTDADVVAAVRREFKLAYPGKRWGSTFAKAELARVRERARGLLLARFEVLGDLVDPVTGVSLSLVRDVVKYLKYERTAEEPTLPE